MNALTRWNQIHQEMNTMRKLMDDMTAHFSWDTAKPLASPALDIVEQGDRIEVHADLPGVAPEEVNIEFQAGTLVISAEVNRENADEGENKAYTRRERYHGSYRRVLRLPETLDVEQAQANFENGVLTLTLPKKPEAQPLRIPVKDTKALASG